MIVHYLLLYVKHIAEAMIGVVAFSILFHAPKKEWLACGISGTIGWILYCILHDLGFGIIPCNFAATVGLTLFSRWMAAYRQAPVSVFLVPGIFPLVPGAGIYYTAYYFFMEDPARGSEMLLDTMAAAGSITVGIIFGSFLITGVLQRFHASRLTAGRPARKDNR